MHFIYQDKVLHAGAYYIMGVLAWRFFNDYFSKQSTVIIISLCFCSLYGISDEWHQTLVPGRDADIWDWLADTLGATIAVTTIWLTKKRLKINKQAG
jgi:VanZ family protein